jgi:hypothetical protein
MHPLSLAAVSHVLLRALARCASERAASARALSLLAPCALLACTIGCVMDVGGGAPAPVPADPTGAPIDDPDNDVIVGEGEGEQGGEGEGEQIGEGEGEEGEGEGEQVGEGEGEGEGEEEPPDPCPLASACTSAPTLDVVFSSSGANPTVTVDGGTAIAIGNTRSAAASVLTPSAITDAGNPYRTRSCASGLQVQYVDMDGVYDALTAKQSDAVARIIAGPEAHATYGDVIIGEPLPAGTAGSRTDITGGAVIFQASEGMEILVDDDDTVVGLVAYKPQTSDKWTLALNLTPTGGSLGSLTTGSSTFADAASVLGTAYDSQGVATVEVSFFTQDVFIRTWAALGVRLAGLCDGSCSNPNSITISSITVTPPFLGKDGAVGLGAPRADVDDLLGVNGNEDDNGITVYGPSDLGDSPLGVAYMTDTQCEDRAATFIVGYASL